MRTKTLNFLDKLAERGENRFSLKMMRVKLINIADIGRNEITAYTKYLIDSNLVKKVGPEVFEINHELRLELRREEDAKNSKKHNS